MKLPIRDYLYVPFLSPAYRRVKWGLLRRMYEGAGVHCPLCGHDSRCWVGGERDGTCPQCGSFARHRLLWMMLQQSPQLRARQCTILYFAPDGCLEDRLRSLAQVRCTTTDLLCPDVDVQADITHLPFADNSFDAVICCHVLEHVWHDGAAMLEMQRVLRPGGVAYIQVPLNMADLKTDEDAGVTDPRERARRFGQFDHVRKYGRDIVQRLAKAGFNVSLEHPIRHLPADQKARLGLWDDAVCYCRKPAAKPEEAIVEIKRLPVQALTEVASGALAAAPA